MIKQFKGHSPLLCEMVSQLRTGRGHTNEGVTKLLEDNLSPGSALRRNAAEVGRKGGTR